MKKVFVVIVGSSLMLTSMNSCSSTQGTTTAALGQAAKNAAVQASEQLIVNYLTQKLAGGHPTLQSVLAGSTASTPLSSILGTNGQNTGLLSSLVSSQFGLSSSSVTNALKGGGTLGSFASFLGQNTNASTLTSLLSGLR